VARDLNPTPAAPLLCSAEKKDMEGKGMTGGAGASVREGGEKELCRRWAILFWKGEMGRPGGSGLVGDRDQLGLV
jgi:hypothetical protein